MRISIVTPSFQCKKYLKETIDSVLYSAKLSNVDLEYIVIDGGSTDGTKELLSSYSKELAYWCSEPDEGQYDAINKGFSKSSGDILAWLNATDLYMPWTLGTVVEIFTTFPQIKWISSLKKVCIRENGTFESLGEVEGFSSFRFRRGGHGGPKNSEFIQQESCFWRRELWEAIGGRIDTRWKFAGDFWLWGQFFQHARCTGVGAPLAAFRFHDGQRSTEEKYLCEVYEILEKLKRLDKKKFVRGCENLVRVWKNNNLNTFNLGWKIDVHSDDIYLELVRFINLVDRKLKWKIPSLFYLPIAVIKFILRGFKRQKII